MSLEEKILINMKQYLGSEEVTEKINNAIKKATDDVIRDLFTGYHSPIKEIIDKNLRTGLLNQMKEEDYSTSVVSLELLVRQVIKDASAENNNTLKRFKDWATFEPPKVVKTSEIFKKYLEFVGKYINTSELEVEADDEPYYIGGEATMEITTGGTVKLVCENDTDLNFEFDIADWNKTIWFRDREKPSLRMVDEFEFWLRNLAAHKVPVKTDETYMSDEIEVEEEPEASF
jgi:hypothetical protein